MRTLTLWVRTASTATAGRGRRRGGRRLRRRERARRPRHRAAPGRPQPATLSELTLRELGSTGPVGITANFRYADSLVPTTSLIPQASAGGSSLPLVTGAERPALVRPRAPADGVPDRARATPSSSCTARTRSCTTPSDGTAFAATLPSIATLGQLRTGLAGAIAAARSGCARRCAISTPVPGVTAGRPSYTVRMAPLREHRPPERGGARGRRRHRHAAPARRLRPRPAQAAGRVRALERPLRRRSIRRCSSCGCRSGCSPVPVALRRPAVARRDRGVHRPGPARRPAAAELPRGQPLGRAARAGCCSTASSFGSVVVLEQPGGGDPGGGLWGLLPSVSVSGGRRARAGRRRSAPWCGSRAAASPTPCSAACRRQVVEAVARGL